MYMYIYIYIYIYICVYSIEASQAMEGPVGARARARSGAAAEKAAWKCLPGYTAASIARETKRVPRKGV